MPCDSLSFSYQARRRALGKLSERLRGARVEAETTDFAGNTLFRAVTDDGLVLTGTLDAAGNVTGVQIDGWSIAERAGWCDECSMAALRGTDVYDRLVREVRSAGAGVAVFGRDAIIIGGKK